MFSVNPVESSVHRLADAEVGKLLDLALRYADAGWVVSFPELIDGEYVCTATLTR